MVAFHDGAHPPPPFHDVLGLEVVHGGFRELDRAREARLGRHELEEEGSGGRGARGAGPVHGRGLVAAGGGGAGRGGRAGDAGVEGGDCVGVGDEDFVVRDVDYAAFFFFVFRIVV